jgi:exopolyphosphatase/guanosine-5'-triphosphate,3'-diphosphate pyrophosphatase|tara:strand:+ start:2580 stop:3467 length:888 start_codon:yes stop_codon:yes gene_type:complete
LKIKKYAAIDIGSNAIRLLISNVITRKNEQTQYKKSSLVRVPIRLGADTFVKGKISTDNRERMADALNAFKLIMKVNNVEKYRACATSALREASNGQEIIKYIFEKTSVQIELIDGKTEAEIIFSTDLTDFIREDSSYLYVDVGGGSTEFTVFSEGKIINSKSFKTGTVRLLDKKVSKKHDWRPIEKWIKENTNELKNINLIGSGGNINKIYKMSGKAPGKSLSYIYLNAHYKFLKQMSYEERITELSLNPDRADVIIPASKIYLNAMKWSNSTKIYVPKIGLSDGIIKTLHQNS